MTRPEDVQAVIDALGQQHPGADTELRYANAFELLVATILSAQSTDAGVNRATPALFARYPDAAALAAAAQEEVEQLVLSTGFYRQKAKAIIGMAHGLVARHGGQVPASMDALVKLPGVGRKTANVVLNIAFGVPTIAVDTHIFRVSNRTGIAPGKNPLEVEQKLLKFVPAQFHLHAHHWLILHGRYVCKAMKPDCPNCLIRDLCECKAKTCGETAARREA